MGQTRMGPPESLLLAMRREFGIDRFIETGTYRGDTAAWAAQRFAQVTTIELSPTYHARAVERFRTTPNVTPLLGDSASVLRRVVSSLEKPAVFWLDAHWMGGDSASGNECPILDELAAIDTSVVPHVILVDDARLFCAPPPRPHRAEIWPELATVVGRLHRTGTRYVAIFDDVFIAVPIGMRALILDRLQELATERRINEGRRSRWRWWR